MTSHSRLKHTAAGLLGSLMSRNNDVDGHWAPGLLYRDAYGPPHTLEVDLLTHAGRPTSDAASRMAANYAAILRVALQRQGVKWEALTGAIISFQFNARVLVTAMLSPCAGDPFICTVTLKADHGRVATASATGRCFPYRPGAFTRSTRASQ